MSDYQRFYSRIQHKIENMFYRTILPPKLIIGLQTENKKVFLIATSDTEYFFYDISSQEFEEAMVSINGTKIHDAYFDISFSVPVDEFLPRAK